MHLFGILPAILSGISPHLESGNPGLVLKRARILKHSKSRWIVYESEKTSQSKSLVSIDQSINQLISWQTIKIIG